MAKALGTVARGSSSTDVPQRLIDASHRGGPPRGVLRGVRGGGLQSAYVDRGALAMPRAAWIEAAEAWAAEAGLTWTEACEAVRAAWSARS